MQASELIQLLEYAIEEHGDRPVCVDSVDGFITGAAVGINKRLFMITSDGWAVAHRYQAGPWGQPLYHPDEELTPLSPSPQSP